MKRLIFTDHAQYQMRERQISKIIVTGAMRNPDHIQLQKDGRKKVLKRIIQYHKNYLLLVVYEEETDVQRIITVFITSKLQKYLIQSL